jgi:hypothetical protein
MLTTTQRKLAEKHGTPAQFEAAAPPTKERVAELAVRPDIVALVNLCLVARTIAELTREKVDAAERQVLAECPLPWSAECRERGLVPKDAGHRITDIKHVYLAEKECRSEHYQALSHKLRADGVKPPEMPEEWCPALCAESVQTDTERDLIKLTWREYTGRAEDPPTVLCGDRRKKWLDLWIGLVVEAPGYKQPVPR